MNVDAMASQNCINTGDYLSAPEQNARFEKSSSIQPQL